MAEQDNGVGAGTVFLSFLAGAAVGAGVALLIAPKTGEELRTKIKGLADDAIDKIKDYTNEAQEKIKSTLDDGKDIILEKKSIISSAIEAGKEAMDKERDRLKGA